MNARPLPFWRHNNPVRLVCALALMAPALLLHILLLDHALGLRLAILSAIAVPMSILLRQLEPGPGRSTPTSAMLDALIPAWVLAALWIPGLPLWPVATAFALALLVQRLLGGSAVNPFPPAMLALAMAAMMLRASRHAELAQPLVSLIDAAWPAAAWLLGGIILAGLRLSRLRGLCGFLLPTALVWLNGGIATSALLTAIIAAGFVVADARYLPVTHAGQFLVGLLAGLGTAVLWFADAPVLSFAGAVLLACWLSPWIEQRTLPRPPAKPPVTP